MFKSGNKAGRPWRSSKDKVKVEPESTHPILDEPKCFDDHGTLLFHGLHRCTSPTIDIRLTDGGAVTRHENVDVPVVLSTTMHMDGTLENMCHLPDSSEDTLSPASSTNLGDVEDEEESLLGLQFLTEHDDGEHDATMLYRTDVKLYVPLLGDKSFCLSSDTDDDSTDTVDSSSMAPEATKIYYTF